MTDENKNGKADEAEVVEAEAKLPMGKFAMRELRKLLEKIGPVLISALVGGSTAFVGWQVQGRGQAKSDAMIAARDEVRLQEEFEAFLRYRAEPVLVPPTAPVAAVSTATVSPITTIGHVLPSGTTPLVDQNQEQVREVIDQFAKDRGLDPEAAARLRDRGLDLMRQWEAEERRASRDRFQEPSRLVIGSGPDQRLQQPQDQGQHE